MAGWAASLRNQILDKILRDTNFEIDGPLKVSLHTADPGLTGANEVTGGSYARQNIAFDAASAGAADSTATVDFTAMPACTVTHISIWDNATFMMSGPLAASKTVNSGDTFELAADDVDVILNA
jgi:hypothetical protein